MKKQMIEKNPATCIESLEALISRTAEMLLAISRLSEDMGHRGTTTADLQSQLNTYWNLPDDGLCKNTPDSPREEHEQTHTIS